MLFINVRVYNYILPAYASQCVCARACVCVCVRECVSLLRVFIREGKRKTAIRR